MESLCIYIIFMIKLSILGSDDAIKPENATRQKELLQLLPLLMAATLALTLTAIAGVHRPLHIALIAVNGGQFVFFSTLFFSFYLRAQTYAPVWKHLATFCTVVMPFSQLLFIRQEGGIAMYYFPVGILLLLELHAGLLNHKQFIFYFFLVTLALGGGSSMPGMVVDSKSLVFQMHATSALLLALGLLLLHIRLHRQTELKRIYDSSLIHKMRSVVTVFSDILSKDKNLDQLIWDVAQECIPYLELEDCVIYLLDEPRNVLVQKAAYGDKDSGDHIIYNPIEIPLGKGIVGSVAISGKAEIVSDTSADKRYIPDDQYRLSEMTVPIIAGGKVVGVIDSEHRQKNFFNEGQLYLMQIIASLCANKITEIQNRSLAVESQQLKEKAEKLEELDEMKTKFIANISHDLKTPLTLMLGPSQKLLSAGNDQVREHAQLIHANAQHLKKIIDQLLDLNQLEFSLQKINATYIHCRAAMENWLLQYQQNLKAKNIHLHLEGDEDVQIPCDEQKLSAIFHNLVANAIKYTPAGGRIIVSYTLTNGQFALMVTDNGPGIPAAQREKVFERFYRLHDADGEGTGIGLSLVKDLTELLGGKVAIGDDNGKGCVVTVKLHTEYLERFTTADDANKKKEHVDYALMTEGNKPIVLVVEDHPQMLQFIAGTLEEHYTCLTARNGQEGIELANKFLPDIIVTDLMMPVMDGEALCRELKANSHTDHIPILILSARSQAIDRITLYRLGAANYLSKPFESEELIAMIQTLIMQSEKLQQKFRIHYKDHQDVPGDSPESSFLQKAIQLILENLDEDYGVKQMGDALLLGRNQLQRKIKALTGYTPVEFIRYVRLTEAKKLLKGSNMNVSEVAYKVGFTNLSYFTRCFKEVFNELPSDVVIKQETF